jgi:hypothetical protein
VLFDQIPLPRGTWGLGPEFPRRVPTLLPVVWASALVGGEVAGKAVMVLCVAAGFAGVHRLARGAPALPRLGAALLYGASPWMLSRLGIGHFGMIVPAAVLPWALPDLLRPNDRPVRAFWWMAAMGLGGFVGGVMAGAALLVGLIADRGRNGVRVVGAFLLAQVTWLVPGLIVAFQGGADPATGDGFATVVDGPLGVLQVAAGHGLWLTGYQVGKGTPGVWLVGAGLIALAWLGRHRLPAAWGGRALALAGAGLALSLASGLPLLGDLYVAVARTPIGVPLREGQRLLPLWLVWLAPAAAHGAAVLAGRAQDRRPALAGLALAAPLAAALVLAGPGLWGLGGILRPIDLPPEWAEAQAAVEAEPGTVLALPWTRYMVAEVAGNRRILNPVPLWLGGDVLSSSDPRVGDQASQEVGDPREASAELLVLRIRTSERVSDDLAALGVRWVVLQHELTWRDHEGLALDPGLELVVEGETLDLYRVEPWRGPVVDDSGATVARDAVVTPWAGLAPSGEATWGAPAARGWLRGTDAAARTSDGLVRLPAGSGPLWFWPSVLVLSADLVLVGALVATGIRARRAAAEVKRP